MVVGPRTGEYCEAPRSSCEQLTEAAAHRKKAMLTSRVILFFRRLVPFRCVAEQQSPVLPVYTRHSRAVIPSELVVHVGQIVVVRVDELVPLQVGHLDSLALDLMERRQSKITN